MDDEPAYVQPDCRCRYQTAWRGLAYDRACADRFEAPAGRHRRTYFTKSLVTPIGEKDCPITFSGPPFPVVQVSKDRAARIEIAPLSHLEAIANALEADRPRSLDRMWSHVAAPVPSVKRWASRQVTHSSTGIAARADGPCGTLRASWSGYEQHQQTISEHISG